MRGSGYTPKCSIIEREGTTGGHAIEGLARPPRGAIIRVTHGGGGAGPAAVEVGDAWCLEQPSGQGCVSDEVGRPRALLRARVRLDLRVRDRHPRPGTSPVHESAHTVGAAAGRHLDESGAAVPEGAASPASDPSDDPDRRSAATRTGAAGPGHSERPACQRRRAATPAAHAAVAPARRAAARHAAGAGAESCEPSAHPTSDARAATGTAAERAAHSSERTRAPDRIELDASGRAACRRPPASADRDPAGLGARRRQPPARRPARARPRLGAAGALAAYAPSSSRVQTKESAPAAQGRTAGPRKLAALLFGCFTGGRTARRSKMPRRPRRGVPQRPSGQRGGRRPCPTRSCF
jgi:hypothetical protein